MNVKLLRRIERHILAEPKRFWMRWFVIKKTEYTPKVSTLFGDYRPFPKCETAACIAGWACILSKVEADPNKHLATKAAELLGLDVNESARLFVPQQWPKQFKGGVTDDGKKKTVKIAVDRIEHFIKTRGKE